MTPPDSAESGAGDTGAGDTGAGDTGAGDTGSGDAGASRPSGRGFSDVDRAGDPGHFVRYLDQVSATEFVRRYKGRALEMLDVHPGQRILDVGCGTGEDARHLARLVGPQGFVLGIDQSETMVAQARERIRDEDAGVEFRQGDILRLDLDDASFDRARADRVLQHLHQPHQALAELARVTRPGGRVLVADSDWGILVVDAPDTALTRKVTQFICDSLASGWIGRRLPRLFHEAGLDHVQLAAALNTFTDARLASDVLWLRGGAVKAHQAGVLDSRELRRWLAFLDDAERSDRFFAASGGFVVAGRRPPLSSSVDTPTSQA